MERISATIGEMNKVSHRFLDFAVGIQMVANGMRCTVLPQLALQEINSTEYKRHIIARIRFQTTHNKIPLKCRSIPAVQAILEKITSQAASIKN